TGYFSQAVDRAAAVHADDGRERFSDARQEQGGLRRRERVPYGSARCITEGAGRWRLAVLHGGGPEVHCVAEWQGRNDRRGGKGIIRSGYSLELRTRVHETLVERKLGQAAPVRVHDVDLFVAVAIAVERDPRAVGRPAGGVIPDAVLGELLDAVPVRPHDEDIEVRPIAVAAERDPRAVGRPAAAPVVRAVVRELSNAAAVQIQREDLEVTVPVVPEQ